MDENTNQPSTTPLGNERSQTPGQDNIITDMPSKAPSWDENTPLSDITKQYTDIGTAFTQIAENAADNVGDRQVQLVGNDFGATNPYMFNTYYEPSATAFASEMRQQGTQKALEEGLDRGEKEARNKLSAAQQRYSNALAAAKQREEQRRQAKAHVSETDMSKMPAGTNEREVLNSEAFKNMNDKEREDALTSARIADLQAKQGDKGVTDWNIKNERKTATSATKKKFGITDEQWNGMSKEQKDAFWARQDVGNYWTEQYMVADFKRRGESAGSKMVETFDDIHNDVNTIIQAVKNNTVASLDTHVFETVVPVAVSPTEYKFETVKKDILNSDLEQSRKDEYIAVMDQVGKEEFERLIHDYAKKDLILEDSGTLRNKNFGGFGNSDTYTFNGESKSVGFAIKDIYNTFAGNVENLENMSHADWVGSVSYSGTNWYNPSSSLTGSQMADELFNNAFGVDWSSISALTKLEKENPDDYNYLLNQSAYILASGGAPFGVVEDANKKYFINGKWVSANDENSPISVGDLVFYSVDGTINSDGKYNDPELQRFVDLYRKIYNGEVEATEENQKLLNSYYSKYQTTLAAAMAATGRYGMQVNEDVYSAMLSMRDNAEDNKLEFTNPAKPNEKITLKDLAEWFNSFSEDEQYNGYTALVNRTRGLKGRYYIYGDSGISSVGTKQNGVDTIGKYGKTEGSENMKMANQIAKLSDEQCLALNIFLDNKMKNGNIQTGFFDNDEVSLGDGIANSFWNAVRGTVSFVGWGATSLFGLATGNQDALKAAGGIWDEMTTIDQKDNWAGNGDTTLFNNYTEDVRKMQRSNLNHLIDTTFNLNYFDPSNTYDAATGEVKNSKGEVVAYTDNHYFHKDDWKGFTDNMAGLVGFVGEVLLEGIATAGVGTALRAAKGAFKATSAGQKLSTAKNALSNILTAQASKNGVSQAIKLNQANAFIRRAQDVLGNPTMVNYLVNNTSKLANIGDDVAGMAANITKISAGAKKAAGAAAKASDVVASFGDDVAKITGKAPDVVDDLTKQTAKGVAGSADNIADDITKKTLTEGEERIASDAMEVVEQYQMLAEHLKPGLDEAAGIYKQQFAFDAGLAAVADDIDDAARIASEKIANYFTKQLDNMSFGEMVGKQAVANALKDVSYDGIRRAAVNTALSEATGIATTRLANLSDDTARLLYDVMQTTRGSNIMKTNDIMAYISNRNVYRTGADVASGTIDFKKAAEGVVSASETALNAGKTLDVADALRIIAKNSTEKGELISALKRSAFWKDRISDYTRDIMQGYYSPHLDEHFESDYTDVVEYMTDPTQLAMGALFDISISGARKGINSLRLGRINSKLDKLVHNVELDAGVANDSVKISRDLRKMSNLKFKADKLTNNVFDGSISYNKVHDAATNVENQINAQLDKITDHFDIEKSLNFMSENINNAVNDSGKLDRFKGFTGFGKTKIASATDINRALIRSDDNLKAFIYANDALKSKSVMRFADIVHSSPNIGKLSNEQYQAAFIRAWDNTISKTDFAKQFGEANLVKSKDGKYTSTINVANKEKAKELFAQGQELVWNAFYDELAKGKSQLDGVVDFRSLKTELNGIRDRIVAVGNEMIDNGQSVRWNYFPTQGILWSAGDDTPISLVGYFYGASSQEHKSLASNITDPNAERDTIDMSKIVSDLKEGKTEYERKLSFNEKVRAERAGDLSETKLTPYNENGFNPIYAVTAYLNAYDSKKFAASYLDPLKRGNVVIKDNGALNARLTNSKVAKIADVAEYRKALREKLTKSSKNKIKNTDITDAIKETRTSLYDTKIASDRAKIGVARRKLRQTIADSDQFKAITTYMDISSPTNEQIAARIQDRFNTMVSDINSVRKGTSEGLSELYTNTNSVQYRAVIDGLAKNDAVAKDLGNLDGRTINFGKTDLNYDAFNKRYYGVIGIMESAQRAIDNIDASKKITPELTLDELEFMSSQNAALSQMDNATTTKVVNESVQTPANAAEQSNVSFGDWMFTELNRHYKKPKYDDKTVSAIADKYLDKVTKAQTADEITKVADEIASDLVPLDPEVKGSSTELKHATTDIQNAIHWLKETAPKASSQPVESTTISAPRYSVEDFVKIRDINENSKSQITSIIYNMMLNKYGDKEVNGKKTFTSSILKDIINQYAYDAYDNVTLNKTHGEGITAAEVIERFNDVFPNMEMFSDDGYKAIQNVSSKMSSYQSNGGDLNTLKQDIANTLKRANDGEIKLTPEQVRRLAAAYYDLDEATLSSDRITNRGRSELSSDNRVSGDEDGMTFADTFASEADYGMDPAQRAMEAEAAATPKREGMNLELPSNTDRSIPGKVNNLNYVMDFLARRESDYRTRVRANKSLWDTYNDVIKPNYEAVVNGINAQVKDGKGIKLLKVDRQFEGMSDANWLRITKQFDAGAESIDVAGKTYSRKEIAKIIKNGIDGRGAVVGMDPARLRAYIKNNNIKVTKPMAEALDNLEKTYSDFAKDFLDTSKRRTVSGTSVSPRDAVFNILASNLDPEHKALNFNAGYLMAPSTDDFYINNNNGAFKFPDADGDIAEVRIKYDYGTGSEGTTGTATYWYEKTDSDGNTVRYDSEEELAASLANNVTADDVRYAMNEAGYNLNVGDNGEIETDYFYHGNRNTPRGIDNVGPDYEDWQITNDDRGKPKKRQGSKKDIAYIDAEIKKLGNVGELTDAERTMYKQITDSKMPYDVLADEYKAVYNKAKNIDRKNSLLAAKRDISAKTATAGTDPMVDFIGDTVSDNMTKSAINIENALYGKDGKAGFVDTINELTNDISKRTLNRDAKFHSTFDDLVVKVKSSYDVESKQALMSTLENIKLEYRQKFPGEDTEGIDELVDSLIKVLDEDFKDKDALINAMVENDSVLKAMQDDIDNSADEVVSGKSMININENGPIIVSDDVDITNKISIADLRKARELVTMKKDGKTILADVGNRKKDKKILKSMREGFTDGYTKKQLVSEASFNKQNAWIDNLVSEIKKSTGNMDIDESKIYINKTVASLGQTFFGEGTAGWQERMYKVMTTMSNFNKMMQDFHLAGGVGQYNAFTLRNALTMMMQDPISGARALVTNFKNAKTNQAVISFMIDNSEKLLKYALDSGDFSAINSFAPLIGMREETVGKGFFTRAVEAAVGTPATIAESQAKLAGFRAAASNIYAEIFNNPTFARWTAVANADLQLRNYNLASRYVDKLVRRYNLTEEDFQRMEGGMGGRDRFVAHLAQLRTEMYWHPQEFFKSGFNAGKYDKVKAAKNEKRTVESLRGMPKKTTAADAFRNFFFAMNYKLQMNMHPVHGFGSIFSSIYQMPRMSGQISSGRSLNLAASRFAGRGNRNEAAVLIGIAALAHAWNTYIGAPSAWSELWDDNEQSKDGSGIPTGIARSLMNLQDFFKFWMPNTDNGKFDQNQQGTALDPAFSIFTLWNSGARATNALINPNDAHISWERNDLGLQNWQIGDWKIGRGLEGFSDELIGANLLAGYKAIYEVFNNNTYFGNNIWEQPKLPNGEDNPNYDAGRNMMASIAHILNLDGALEGNMWGAGTNRWVKGLDIDSINWEHGEKLATPKSKGLKMGNKGVYQDKTGTVSGSGLIQHEYVTALQAINDGDYFEALSGAMELPFKSRNYASRARTSLNQEVSLALRDAKKEYDATVKNATNEEKDKAYAKFAKKAVDIVHDWSHKYGDVLGKNDELTSAATKILMSFMADEYNDDTMYAQNMYSKLRQDLKMAMGDEFIFSKQAYEDAIASGMSPEEAAETWNKHLTALQEAQMKEYKARVALEEAGINEGLDTSIFDTTDFMHDKFEADNATISKKIYTEIKGKLDGQIGEFKNFMEMKDYYEEMINNASTTKQKAKLANKYNEYVEGVISPYIEEYGAAVVNSAYWDGDNVMNHFGKYIIIPADKYYNGKSPRSSFLKDELHIGYRDSSALPSDEEVKEELNKVAKALAKGQVSSAASLVDNALLQLRKGALHASPEDRQKLIRMRALLSSRRK